MKAKLLRIAALLTVALLTTAAPCDPTGADTVYVVHEAQSESGPVTLGHAYLFGDRSDGFLTLQFSRDGAGNIVDGPVTLKNFYLTMFVDGFGSIVVSLDAPVTSSLSSVAEGVGFNNAPLTAHISVTCSTRCEHIGIPFGTSEASLPLVEARLDLFAIAADYIRGNVTSATAWAGADLGLGGLDFKIAGISFRGSTSPPSP
jgi:hypothetical protein